jgi:hypothetical protein
LRIAEAAIPLTVETKRGGACHRRGGCELRRCRSERRVDGVRVIDCGVSVPGEFVTAPEPSAVTARSSLRLGTDLRAQSARLCWTSRESVERTSVSMVVTLRARSSRFAVV